MSGTSKTDMEGDGSCAALEPTGEHHASFKPAATFKAVSWSLKGCALFRNGVRVLNLDDVTHGSYFSEVSYKTGYQKALTLQTANGSKAKLQFGSLAPNEGMRQYVTIVETIASELADVRPEARIHMAGGSANTWSAFVCGIIGIAFGILFLSLAPGASFGAGTLLLALLGLGVLTFGACYSWHMRPWNQDRLKISAERFANGILKHDIEL